MMLVLCGSKGSLDLWPLHKTSNSSENIFWNYEAMDAVLFFQQKTNVGENWNIKPKPTLLCFNNIQCIIYNLAYGMVSFGMFIEL